MPIQENVHIFATYGKCINSSFARIARLADAWM